MASNKVIASFLIAAASTAAQADIVTDWNVIAINASATPPNAILQSRTLAIVHAAIYDAVRAVEGGGAPYAAKVEARSGASIDAAVAAAAHGVLTRLAPASVSMLDAALAASLANVPEGRAKADGATVGASVAKQLVSSRSEDGADASVAFTSPPGAGRYQPTPPHLLPAILPHWGRVKPFVLSNAARFPLNGPPPVESAAFARDYEEVRRLGVRQASARSADQTAAAVFWTVQTAVPWHAAARAVAAAKRFTVIQNATMFAMLAMATADSQIVAFAEKYRHPHWRPITAIRAGVDAAGLEADPRWEPLLGTPPHPEYPSAHSIFSGAAEAVLRHYLGGDDIEVSVTSPPVFGITRTWRKLSQISEEVEHARVSGGIHFRTAVRDGTEAGRRIGAIIVRDFPNRPVD